MKRIFAAAIALWALFGMTVTVAELLTRILPLELAYIGSFVVALFALGWMVDTAIKETNAKSTQ